MAEESTNSLLLTPEKNELDSLNTGKNTAEYSDSLHDGGTTDSPHDRASTGIYHGGDSRSNSTEKLESVKRKKVPHYLKASTGSCHDLCKYGRKHEFGGKARTPLRNQIAKLSPTEQNAVGKKNSPGCGPSPEIKFVSPKLPSSECIPVSLRKSASSDNKIQLTKHKISPCKLTPSPGLPEVKRETSLPGRNFEVPIEDGSLSDTEMLATEKKTCGLTKKHSTVHLKSVKDKMKSPSDYSDGLYGALRRNSDVMPVKRATEIKTSGRLKSAKDKMKSPSGSSAGIYGALRRYSDVMHVKRATEIITSAKKPTAPLSSNSCSKISLSKTPSYVSLRKSASSGNKIHLIKHKISPCKKTPSPGPLEVKRETSLPSGNFEVPIEDDFLSDSEMLATEKKTCGLTKKQSTAHIKSVSVKDKMKSPPDSSDDIYGALRRNSDVMPVKRATEIKTSAQRATAPLSSNSFSKISPSKTTSTQSRKARNLVPLPNNENKIHRTNAKTSIDEQVPGKNLQVIKMRSNAKTPPLSTRTLSGPIADRKGKFSSSTQPLKDVDRATHKFVPDKNKLFKTSKASSLTQNPNKTSRKSRMIVSDDKHQSPVKLKFKSGKVVDIQSDNNTPRRLKFRRARINTTNVGISSVKVVLKHRDVQGRKGAQGLFNNVIEETASKLVKSRKSKVKALVGAFETVISLQDSKPSSRTVKSTED